MALLKGVECEKNGRKVKSNQSTYHRLSASGSQEVSAVPVGDEHNREAAERSDRDRSAEGDHRKAVLVWSGQKQRGAHRDDEKQIRQSGVEAATRGRWK